MLTTELRVTVTELKTMAKGLGLKGYSKLNKVELIELIKAATATEGATVAEEVTVTEEPAVDVIVEENANVDSLDTTAENKTEEVTEMERKMTLVEYVDSIRNKVTAEELSAALNKRENEMLSIMKKESKKMDIVLGRQVIFYAEELEDTDRIGQKSKKVELRARVEVTVSLESNVTRFAAIRTGKFADSTLTLAGKGTEEVISVSLDKSLFIKTTNEKRAKLYEGMRNRAFKMLKGSATGESLCVIANEQTGEARVKFDKHKAVASAVNEHETVRIYRFLGITPSGLRTKSMMGASTFIKTFGVDRYVACDRREAILNESTDGCFIETFKDAQGAYVDVRSKVNLFKNSTRLTLGATPSKKLPAMKNYIVFDNLGAGCTFFGKDASDTRDGNVFQSVEYLMNYYNAMGTPVSKEIIIGVTSQTRGAGSKDSATAMDRADLKTLVYALLNRRSAKVVYTVIDGVRYEDFNEVRSNKELMADLFRNIDLVADTNAFKMTQHRPDFSLVQLKMAYKSPMNLSSVTAKACLLADEEKAVEVFRNKAMMGLARRFSKLGVDFTLSENKQAIESISVDLAKAALNNDSQFMNHLMANDCLAVTRLFPGVVRSNFTNEIKGIIKEITEFSIELERSHYTVVLADAGVLFGKELLAENEIFCRGTRVNRVAIQRHPISSAYSVTILNVVDETEMARRICECETFSEYVKRFLLNYFLRSKETCIVPASHFLMQKHDGMDFDIDAVQIIEDQDIVDLLAKLPNRGSVIKETKEAKEARMIPIAKERAIEAFQQDPKFGLSPVQDEDFNKPKVEVKTSAITVGLFAQGVLNKAIKKSASYTLEFDSVCSVAQEYFESSIASVGEIANAHYNNLLILLALLDESPEAVESKEAIVFAFKNYYKCNGDTQYVSTIDRTAKEFLVDKFDCVNAVYRFACSDGSIHSLIEYLRDCCDYNRYLAETSIDSAKNNYFIINMFAHASIVAALGAKATCAAVESRNDEMYAELCQGLDIDQDLVSKNGNYFGINLITMEETKPERTLDATTYMSQDGYLYTSEGEETDIVATLVVADPLYKVKNQIVTIANQLVVVATKMIEQEVVSQEAKDYRIDIIATADELLEGMGDTAPALDSIERAYAALTLALKDRAAVEEGNREVTKKSKKDVEEISTSEYAKTVAIDGLRNFASLVFEGFDGVQIGAAVCKELISRVTDTECTGINAGLYKVFGDQIIEFLAECGLQNMGFIGESVAYAKVNGKKTSVKKYVGEFVTVVGGYATLEDGTTIVMKDRRAEIEGTIVEENGRYVVKSARVAKEENDNAGLQIAIVNSSACISDEELKAIDVVGYKYAGRVVAGKDRNGKARYAYNVILAIDAEGTEYPAYSLKGRNIDKVLSAAELTEDTFRIFTHESEYTDKDGVEKKMVRKVFNLSGSAYIAAKAVVEQEEAEAESFEFNAPDFSFGDPETAGTESAAATTDSDDEAFGFSFGVPAAL